MVRHTNSQYQAANQRFCTAKNSWTHKMYMSAPDFTGRKMCGSLKTKNVTRSKK